MTDPIKDLFDRHSFDPEQVTLSLDRHMTLDQFRAALTEYAPKWREVEKELDKLKKENAELKEAIADFHDRCNEMAELDLPTP
jgi:cell division protein FtsB